MEKILPVLYKAKNECCGCTACFAVCPKSAITMIEDEEGFEYPIINAAKCVKCYMCVNVCPIK
ncbi:MAG: 4Fe-4S dicluster domain-containing protein [Clostridia bacterium]|nr:4Fe-4S dicluster domain-containing protein [Clostridia bacterium]